MARIIFTNLGRNKWNGSVLVKDGATPDEVAEVAYRESLKRLGSRFPDAEYDANTNKGVITAGSRVVGEYRVEPIQEGVRRYGCIATWIEGNEKVSDNLC